MGEGIADSDVLAPLVRTMSGARARSDVNLQIILALETYLPASSVVTPLRLAHFMAQAAHECGGFGTFVENLNYSADALRRTWPKRFRSQAEAVPYARNPEAIANKVYADRLGNGPEGSGDGWKYRGRGIFQLTGRANYAEYGDKLGLQLEDHPDLAAEATNAVRIALEYWGANGLSSLADRDDIRGITRRINGGENGLSDRAARLRTAKRQLGL